MSRMHGGRGRSHDYEPTRPLLPRLSELTAEQRAKQVAAERDAAERQAEMQRQVAALPDRRAAVQFLHPFRNDRTLWDAALGAVQQRFEAAEELAVLAKRETLPEWPAVHPSPLELLQAARGMGLEEALVMGLERGSDGTSLGELLEAQNFQAVQAALAGIERRGLLGALKERTAGLARKKKQAAAEDQARPEARGQGVYYASLLLDRAAILNGVKAASLALSDPAYDPDWKDAHRTELARLQKDTRWQEMGRPLREAIGPVPGLLQRIERTAPVMQRHGAAAVLRELDTLLVLKGSIYIDRVLVGLGVGEIVLGRALVLRTDRATPGRMLALAALALDKLLAGEKDKEVRLAGEEVEEPAPRAEAARSEGLDGATRGTLAAAFGEDLGEVRVHRESAEAAGAVRAVTVGEDIHLGTGTPGPETREGLEIRGHEVAHVMQQRGQGEEVPAGVSSEGEARLLEEEAKHAAEAVVTGKKVRRRWRARGTRRQGFEPCEHRSIARKGGGGRRIRLDGGLEVAYEDLVWMAGDLYESVEALKKAPKKEVLALLEIGERQEGYQRQAVGSIGPEKQAEIDAAFQDVTAERERTHYEDHKAIGTEGTARGGDVLSYEERANDNHEHFAGENLAKWQDTHRIAKDIAERAFAERARRNEHLNAALLHEAFGAHFLTDAFATGHLVDGTQGREWAEGIIAAEYGALRNAILGAADQDQAFSVEVAAQRAGGSTMDLEISQMIVDSAFWISMGLTHGKEGALASLLLKVVHDEFNRSGVLVHNQRGEEWLATGDLHLWRSPKTQELAAEAVRLGREEIEAVAQGKVWRGISPKKLVPSAVYYGDKWWSLDEFRGSKEVFLGILRPRVFTSSPGQNRLYQMIRGNMLSVAKSKAKEFVIGAAHAVGHGIPRTVDMVMGADVKNQVTDPGLSGVELPDGGVP